MSDSLLKLCQSISRPDLAAVPDPVVRHTKWVLADTLGVMVAGSASNAARALARRLSRTCDAATAATCPGLQGDYDPPTAAMLGGMAGSTLEFEEGHAIAMGHPAIQIVPALAAAAEAHGLSGAQLLAGLISGYEAACRISQACRPREGLHPNGHWGVIGAAMAVACLFQRSAEALVEIANIAACHTITPFVDNSFAGCSAARTFAGMAGYAGLMANLFFDSGIRAEPRSLAMTFSRFVSTHFDPARLANGTDMGYAISGNYFKPYPTCRFTHPALDALQQILDAHTVDPGQVEAIHVYSFKAATHVLAPPANSDALRFSLPHLIGMMLAGRRVDLAGLTDAVLHDPTVLRLAGKVRLVPDPAYEAMRPDRSPARVTVRLTSGRELSASVLSGRGDALNPLPEPMLTDKFLALTEPVLGAGRARQVMERIDRLENEPDVRPLMQMLRPG